MKAINQVKAHTSGHRCGHSLSPTDSLSSNIPSFVSWLWMGSITAMKWEGKATPARERLVLAVFAHSLLATHYAMINEAKCFPVVLLQWEQQQQSNHNFIITLFAPLFAFATTKLISDSALNSLITRLTNLSQVKTGTSLTLPLLPSRRAVHTNWQRDPFFYVSSSSPHFPTLLGQSVRTVSH